MEVFSFYFLNTARSRVLILLIFSLLVKVHILLLDGDFFLYLPQAGGP